MHCVCSTSSTLYTDWRAVLVTEAFSMTCPAPYTLNTLHPTPYTLHPPYTTIGAPSDFPHNRLVIVQGLYKARMIDRHSDPSQVLWDLHDELLDSKKGSRKQLQSRMNDSSKQGKRSKANLASYVDAPK